MDEVVLKSVICNIPNTYSTWSLAQPDTQAIYYARQSQHTDRSFIVVLQNISIHLSPASKMLESISVNAA